MADLAAVMDELGAALDAITGLRVFPYHAEKLTPPAAVVMWPDAYEFDKTYGRGADRVVLPVMVVVGRADARSTRDRLAQYAAGSGSSSVKQVVEAHTPTSYESVRVRSVAFDAVQMAGAQYLAATFDTEIIMKGAV